MRAFFRLIRFPLAFTAASNSMAGFLVASSRPDVGAAAVVGLLSVFIYSLGMVLNDLADVERDRSLHPDRPLVKGEISLGGAWLWAMALLAGAVGLSIELGPGTAAVAGALILLVFAYDFALKRLSILGAFGMGAARGMNFLLGLAAVTEWGWHPYAIVLFCYIAAITCISLLEEAPRRSFFIAYSIAAGSAALCVAYFGILREGWAGSVLAAAVAAAIFAQMARALRSFGRDAVLRFVFGGLLLIIPLDSAAVMTDPSKVGQGAMLLLLLPVALAARWALSRRTPA